MQEINAKKICDNQRYLREKNILTKKIFKLNPACYRIFFYTEGNI